MHWLSIMERQLKGIVYGEDLPKQGKHVDGRLRKIGTAKNAVSNNSSKFKINFTWTLRACQRGTACRAVARSSTLVDNSRSSSSEGCLLVLKDSGPPDIPFAEGH